MLRHQPNSCWMSICDGRILDDTFELLNILLKLLILWDFKCKKRQRGSYAALLRQRTRCWQISLRVSEFVCRLQQCGRGAGWATRWKRKESFNPGLPHSPETTPFCRRHEKALVTRTFRKTHAEDTAIQNITLTKTPTKHPDQNSAQ